MLGQPELAQILRVDGERLQTFVDRGWLLPPVQKGRPMFRDVDVARARLIVDLADIMGVNDEGVDIVLDLLDQLYNLRIVLVDLVDAQEVQPRGIGRDLVDEAQQLHILIRR